MARKKEPEPPQRKHAFCYARASTGRQADSIENQKERTLEYFQWKLAPLGFTWREPFEDLAVSGKKELRSRPSGLALDLELQAGDAVIITKLDRAFRNACDTLNIFNRWKDRGVALHILNLNIDTSTPMGKAMLTMSAAFAELEGSTISERGIESKAWRKAHGKPVGPPPYGFKCVGKHGDRPLPLHTPHRPLGRQAEAARQKLRGDVLDLDRSGGAQQERQGMVAHRPEKHVPGRVHLDAGHARRPRSPRTLAPRRPQANGKNRTHNQRPSAYNNGRRSASRGCVIICPFRETSIDTAQPFWKPFAPQAAAIAEWEIGMGGERVREAIRAKRRRGERWVRCAPCGFKWVPNPKGGKSKRGNPAMILAPDEAQLAQMRQIAQWRLEGLSYLAIWRLFLLRREKRASDGKEWDIHSIWLAYKRYCEYETLKAQNMGRVS